MNEDVFKQIKKQNGEKFAQYLRSYHNGIFEIKNVVELLKYAGHDVDAAKDIAPYLKALQQASLKKESSKEELSLDPIELLDKAGYNAFYVKSLEDQNKIEHYYASAEDLEKLGCKANRAAGEKLCTFRDPVRYKTHYIIHAVKKDVDNIRRADFVGKEKREDLYGTSVISIQIPIPRNANDRNSSISIKNRYNHTVQSCDNTFQSNPDNIIPGLTLALQNKFNVTFGHLKDLPKEYRLVDGHLISFNFEENDIFFGDAFYVKNGEIKELNRDYEIMLSGFILNIKNNTISNPANLAPSLHVALEEEIKGKKLQISADKKNGFRTLTADNEIIARFRDGMFLSLRLPTTEKLLGDLSATHSQFEDLRSFDAPNLVEVGDNFHNGIFGTLNFPKLKKVGKFPDFRHQKGYNTQTGQFYIFEDSYAKNGIVTHKSSDEIFMDNFIFNSKNKTIKNILETEDSFADAFSKEIKDKKLTVLYPPERKNNFNDGSMYKKLENVIFDFGSEIAHNFTRILADDKEIVRIEQNNIIDIDFSKTDNIGNNFLEHNSSLETINLPNVQKIGNDFLVNQSFSVKLMNLPHLKDVGNNFMTNFKGYHDPMFGCLIYTDTKKGNFDIDWEKSKSICFPELTRVGDNFLPKINNDEYKNFVFPKLTSKGENFMQRMDPNKIETPLLSQKDMADKIALIKKKREEYQTAKSQSANLNILKGLKTR